MIFVASLVHGGAFGVLSMRHAGLVEKATVNRMACTLTFTRCGTGTIRAKVVLATKNGFFVGCEPSMTVHVD
jgi:hypothetical protein